MRHRLSALYLAQALDTAMILAVVVFMIMPVDSQANDRSCRRNPGIDSIQNPSGDLQTVQRNLSEETKKTREINRRRQSILNEIHSLDEKIIKQWETADALKKKRTEIELRFLDVSKDYAAQFHALQDIKRCIEIRLAAIGRIGAIGMLNILFSASTIPEMISRESYLKLILENDQKIRNDYLARFERLQQTKKDIENEKEAMEKVSKDIETQTLLFESEKQKRQTYLAEVERQAESHNALLEELNNAAKSLQGVVAELDQKESTFNGRVAPEKGEAGANSFAAQKGKLSPPVEGLVAKKNGMGGPMPGIIIHAPFGSEIRAVFDGKIIYRDTLPGYGKVLIIDHGDNYYSLTAQGAKFFKSTGDKVVEGDIIGIAGSGPLVSEGIYFELRHGKTQKDPLKWLDIKN